MEYRKITDDYAVAGQITADQIAEIKAAGYKSIVCNRPDDEQPGQPSAASIAAAAKAAGLDFRHVPAVSGQIVKGNVDAMAEALRDMEGPVFAYCRSGARSTNLFMLVQEAKAQP